MKQRLLIVCIVCVLASVGGAAIDDLSDTEPERQDNPVFLVIVDVGPATGAMLIPPADPPSRPYRATVRVRWSHEKTERQASLASGEFFAGERTQKTAEVGPYRAVMSAEVDLRGEMAKVFVDVFRNDDGAQVLGQRVLCVLPASQIFQ